MKKTVINQAPSIELFEDFLSKDDCSSLIYKIYENSSLYRKPWIFDFNGIKKIKDNINNSSQIVFKDLDPDLLFLIKNKLSQSLNIDVRRIHNPFINIYHEGNYFGLHYDFLSVKNPDLFTDQLPFGGNRTCTFVLYLNDDYENGHIFFPYENIKVKPNLGSGLFFRYDYDDPNLNIKTVHEVKKVTQGTKITVTFLIYEYDVTIPTTTFKIFEKESQILSTKNNVTYRYEDINFSIDYNNAANNAILIDIEDNLYSLTLFKLITLLNLKLSIPYKIIPIYFGLESEKITSIFKKYELNKLPNTLELICIPERHQSTNLNNFLNSTDSINSFYNISIIFTSLNINDTSKIININLDSKGLINIAAKFKITK